MASFISEGQRDWAINVKNTFINFDHAATGLAVHRRRATSCPPSRACTEDAIWEEATQELCHCMALRRCELTRAVQPRAAKDKGVAGLDSLSEVSTTSGDGSPRTDTPNSTPSPSQEAFSTWTSVASRKKPKQRVNNQTLVQHVREERSSPATPATPSTPSAPAATPAATLAAPATPSWSAGVKPAKPQQPRDEAPQTRGKYDGKGKGLSHFQRIEVGIEDDRDFRVVKRLIGPNGKHMQDITTAARGAKVWIIGRGSRSWEDDVGPLVICVGATSRSTLDIALGCINDLLARVREEHKKFLSR